MCLNSTDTPSPSSPSMPPILHAPHHTQTHGHTLSHFTNTHAHTYTFTNTHHNTHTHTLTHTHTHTLTEPPRVIDLRQEDSADDESVTFVCTVECSIDFHITWLHNGTRLNITEDGKYQSFNSGSNQQKLRVSLTSTSDVGGYTCVLNTAFKRNESGKTIGLWSTRKYSVCYSNIIVTAKDLTVTNICVPSMVM